MWCTTSISGTCNSVSLWWEGKVFPYTRKSKLKSAISMVTGNLNPVVVTDQTQERIRECLIKVGFIDHALSDGIHVLTADGVSLNSNKTGNYPTMKEFEAGAAEWEKREQKRFVVGDVIGYSSTELMLMISRFNPSNPEKVVAWRYYDRNGNHGMEQRYATSRKYREFDGWDFFHSYKLVIPTPRTPINEAEDLL